MAHIKHELRHNFLDAMTTFYLPMIVLTRCYMSLFDQARAKFFFDIILNI